MRKVLFGILVIALSGIMIGCSGSTDDANQNAAEKPKIDEGLKGMPAIDPSKSASMGASMKGGMKGGPPAGGK
ncbi:MAG TPA: hypothetical protein VG820_04200 [Fimbriimonadaceae bacterium]|nr:hypothetical protein [Fimbriimonadaceae bacterium]